MAKQKEIILTSPVNELNGIGPKKAEALNNAGIFTLLDLLRITPKRYEDRSKIVPLSFLKPEKTKQGLFKARLEAISSYHARRQLTIIKAEFSDASKKVEARWFNQKYLLKQLIVGKEYFLFGGAVLQKGAPILDNPEVESAAAFSNENNSKYLTPVYTPSKGLSGARISAKSLRTLNNKILDEINWQKSFPDLNDDSLFLKIKHALEKIHRPLTQDEANHSRFTMAFLDQVLFQMGVLKRREALTGLLSLPNLLKASPADSPYPLPFNLTNAQQQVLGELIKDLSAGQDKPPMSRLVQGDVGSGKTLVAFLAMLYFFTENNYQPQIAFMAPTEILARQHFANFEKFFPEMTKFAAILTGSLKAAERREITNGLASGEIKFLFGTHALFQEKVEFDDLALCIIDEQQRFGVRHRRSLVQKGTNPHQLLLSATPIPRTLSLTIFGDMDTSIIDEMPPGRKPVNTIVATSFNEIIPVIKNTIEKKEQVYFVCPLIEFSDKMDWISVEEAADTIETIFPDLNFACLTGQQSWDEKETIMQSFKNGDLQMVIATTVIEVGVDNPNATLMIIENADRFGLSQLHQLRGRVGRGKAKSTCCLISHRAEDSERLQILASTNDGFQLSMEDLRLRGPGDLVGTRQSGLSHPCFSHNIPPKMVENARKRAYEILTQESDSIKTWFIEQMKNSFGDSYQTFMEGG